MMWRSRKLLDACHHDDLPCTFTFEHECRGQIQPCHSNSQRDGKGMGIKAHDYRVALGCVAAHYEIDQGKRFTKEEKSVFWDEAHITTIGVLFERGIIKVA